MFTRVYKAKINRMLHLDIINALLRCVPNESTERFKRFRFIEDSLRGLFGELLARYAISTHFSISNSLICFSRNEFGKPYAVNLPIHYNISHSGEYVVCAISSSNVGIDVEQITTINIDIAQQFFSSIEYEFLISKDEKHMKDIFFDLWTLKESYIKWNGKGLSIPLDSFSLVFNEAGIVLLDNSHSLKPYFKVYPLDGYKCALCSSVETLHDEIQKIVVEEISLDPFIK